MPPVFMSTIDWGDLVRLRSDRPAQVLEMLTAGDAAGFERALAAGFDVNAVSDVGGSARTSAHHASAAGDVVVLRQLVDRGADLSAVDPTYGATPLGWAEFFDQSEAAAYLRGIAPGDA